MIPFIPVLLSSVKVRKEQGALTEVAVGYHSIVDLDLVVALLGSPPRTTASLSGNSPSPTCYDCMFEGGPLDPEGMAFH